MGDVISRHVQLQHARLVLRSAARLRPMSYGHVGQRAAIDDFNAAVIKDVIANLPGSFAAAGYGDSNLLEQLEQIWKSKIAEANVRQPPAAVPQQPGMYAMNNAHNRIPQAPTGQTLESFMNTQPISGAPAQYMAPAAQPRAAPAQSNPSAYMAQMGSLLSQQGIPQALPQQTQQYAPQQVGNKRPREGQPGQYEGAGDEDDSVLNSDDDEEDDEPQTNNLVLCQFDKVSRAKQRWKITLSDGLARLNETDFVFHKATGELDF